MEIFCADAWLEGARVCDTVLQPVHKRELAAIRAREIFGRRLGLTSAILSARSLRKIGIPRNKSLGDQELSPQGNSTNKAETATDNRRARPNRTRKSRGHSQTDKDDWEQEWPLAREIGETKFRISRIRRLFDDNERQAEGARLASRSFTSKAWGSPSRQTLCQSSKFSSRHMRS
jgi:hypothetical protein